MNCTSINYKFNDSKTTFRVDIYPNKKVFAITFIIKDEIKRISFSIHSDITSNCQLVSIAPINFLTSSFIQKNQIIDIIYILAKLVSQRNILMDCLDRDVKVLSKIESAVKDYTTILPLGKYPSAYGNEMILSILVIDAMFKKTARENSSRIEIVK